MVGRRKVEVRAARTDQGGPYTRTYPMGVDQMVSDALFIYINFRVYWLFGMVDSVRMIEVGKVRDFFVFENFGSISSFMMEFVNC